MLVPLLWHALPACAPCVTAVASSFSVPRSLFLPLPGPWVVSCSCVVSLPMPCPCGHLPVTLGLSLPPCRGVPSRSLHSPCPCPFPSGCGGGGVEGGLWGADGPCLGLGGLEPPAEGLGVVGAAEALDHIPEEGFPCRLRHGGLRDSLVRAGGGGGADLLEGVHHVHPFSPSRSPGPLHPAAELLQGRGRPPSEVGGGLGGGGVRGRGPGAAVVGAGRGGCVRAAGGTGSSMGLVGGGSWTWDGGGGRGHARGSGSGGSWG